MPEGTETNTALTQDQVNGLVGKARSEGREAAQKDFLKSLGFESLEEAQGFIKSGRDKQKGEMSEIERLKADNTAQVKLIAGLTGERDDAALKFKGVSLERAAELVGSELGVSASKARQITKLLGVQAADFDPDKNDLKTRFETFLADAENAHFKTEVAENGGARETSSRKPGATKTNAEPDKFDRLTALLKW